ncbi:dihydroneopterin aldolase [Marinicella litoralis]|uniref:7,8-dihydroneopterin aldolase n=1 Tax=Marinicella litoralis TaxID=644220 RepID=A0A4R6XRB7_9GAMM|nr:dihydroneopterin aldolase [Marinicella litoralis]TDR20534.1 dihydroneopterin aldolase [Marinicella litoralis]
MDKILIRQLKVDAIIGIHEWEKQNKQALILDLDLSFDCKPAAKSDDINDTLDYFKVCQQLTDFISASRFELIETLAEKSAQMILDYYPCKKVKLSLFKPEAINNTDAVGVRITRSQ